MAQNVVVVYDNKIFLINFQMPICLLCIFKMCPAFRLVNTKCMMLVDMWKKIQHSNCVTLREVFTTKAFGDHCECAQPVYVNDLCVNMFNCVFLRPKIFWLNTTYILFPPILAL